MASFGRYGSQSYAPSAPSLPESDQRYNNNNNNNNYNYSNNQHQHQHQYGSGSSVSSYSGHNSYSNPYGYGYGYGYGYSGNFPEGTSQDVIRSFEMVDRDRSGFIDDYELQQALSSGYHRFSLRTVRLLIFLFNNPNHPLKIGPKEFVALWNCLGQWRGIFERYDKDRSGKIDVMELRDALYGLGYMVPGSVLQLLISKYDDGRGQRVELDFDSFVECGMIVKGLTEKFKEKDTRYTGSATFSYDAFMSTIIPFLVSY